MKQGKRSINKYNGMCGYRGPNQMKCAIGVLIPNKCYKPVFDEHGLGIVSLLDNYTPEEIFGSKIEENVTKTFLNDLQTIHDYGKDILGLRNRWKLQLIEFAKTYHLKVPKELGG